MLLVIKQLRFILFSGRVYVRALIQQTPHTQLSFSLSQLLTLTRYLWVQSFNQTQRNIGAYRFASQPFTSRVMSTIIVHDNLHPIGYISGSFQHNVLAQGYNVKRKGEDHHDSCIKVKDRPFAEGSRGCHALL